MRIGLDISQSVYEGSGVARFNEGLISALCDFEKKHTISFYFSGLRRQLPDILVQRINKSGHRLFTYKIPPKILSFMAHNLHKLSENIIPMARDISKNEDVFITSDWSELKLPVKKVTIVHDLVFKRYPETLDKSILKTQEKRMEFIKKESNLIFTDSESTKNDLDLYYQIKKNVIVNYPGVKISINKQIKFEQLKEKLGITKKFILTVGKKEPRKNINRLIEIFETHSYFKDYELVVVGAQGWGDNLKSRNKSIIFTGFLPDEFLYELYRNAKIFIYPSLYEGFGYPIIEAMNLGCPVATSSTSSMGEITNNAALKFNPENTLEIKTVLIKMLENQGLIEELRERGFINAQKYTWSNYQKVLIREIENLK
jgi:glycosyltransferase involved in cell wall biosynthesis